MRYCFSQDSNLSFLIKIYYLQQKTGWTPHPSVSRSPLGGCGVRWGGGSLSPIFFLLCLFFLYVHMGCYVKPKLVCHVHLKHANNAIFTYLYALFFNMTVTTIKTATGFHVLLCLFLYAHMECYVKPKLVCHLHLKHANNAIFTYRYALFFNMTVITIQTATGFHFLSLFVFVCSHGMLRKTETRLPCAFETC